MTAGKFLKQLRHDSIVQAIREAEQRTSGEIRVFISHRVVEDPVAAAQSRFLALEMEKTRERNAVLLFVAPRTHRFAVIGDLGVHQRCGEAFWEALAKEMAAHFREGRFTEGLIHGVRKAGDLLAVHFPHRPDDRNELPDDISQD